MQREGRRIGSARYVVSGLTLLALLAGGCGGDDDGPYTKQCQSFIDTACSANAKCAVEKGTIQSNQQSQFIDSCKSGAASALNCSKVKGVNGDIDQCETDYKAASCDTFDSTTGLPVPASCKQLFLL